ncbi:MAG: TatD family hydrolase [Lachnospiraceae bacterium]|nr:TatD family hydrolase [Lachnospiraceae bacterium]
MIFETHAHYDDECFDEDREELLSGLQEKNVGLVVNVGADLETSVNSVELAKKWDYIYAAVGCHPDEVEGFDQESLNKIKEMAINNDKVVAIGEIGLDYYRKEGKDFIPNQKTWFRKQLDLAYELKKPVIIHSRDAGQDTYDILKEYITSHKDIVNPGVVHCYSYSPEMAKEFVKLGFYIGVGGVVTFKKAKKLVDTVAQIDIENILVETDSPYMSPEPNRGKRNNSANIKYIIDKIAEIKGISSDEVERITEENARKMYGL